MDVKESIESEKDKVKLEPVMLEDLPIRRKRTAEMAGSYDWTPQLVEPGFCAAPVSCFKHVSFSLKKKRFWFVFYRCSFTNVLIHYCFLGSYIRDLG